MLINSKLRTIEPYTGSKHGWEADDGPGAVLNEVKMPSKSRLPIPRVSRKLIQLQVPATGTEVRKGDPNYMMCVLAANRGGRNTIY